MGPARCFPDPVFQAEWTGCTSHQESHYDGFHLDPSSVRKGHLHFARVIRVPTWVVSCCPHGYAVNGELVGDLVGDLQSVLLVSFSEALAYLALPLFCCVVEPKPPGHWGRTSPLSHFLFSPPLPSLGSWGCSSSWVRR